LQDILVDDDDFSKILTHYSCSNSHSQSHYHCKQLHYLQEEWKRNPINTSWEKYTTTETTLLKEVIERNLVLYHFSITYPNVQYFIGTFTELVKNLTLLVLAIPDVGDENYWKHPERLKNYNSVIKRQQKEREKNQNKPRKAVAREAPQPTKGERVAKSIVKSVVQEQ